MLLYLSVQKTKYIGYMRLSTCNAEYVIASQFACQALWLSSLCNVLKLKCKSPKEMKIDNTSAINLAKNSVI